jgi:hypothetical protein
VPLTARRAAASGWGSRLQVAAQMQLKPVNTDSIEPVTQFDDKKFVRATMYFIRAPVVRGEGWIRRRCAYINETRLQQSWRR